jgi:uncharacterized repeat protein (TIGR03806 family)
MRKAFLQPFGLLAVCLLPLSGPTLSGPTSASRAASLGDLAAPRPLHLADLPDGFSEKVVATGITGATAMAIAPDGRVFICEQTGALRIVKNDRLLDQPFITVPVDSSWERGLIGVALDPAFPRKPFIYLCYVAPRPYPHHRVSRFTAQGDAAMPHSEEILFRGDDQTKLGGHIPNGHQGGAIHFGKDGKLYIAIGEQTAGLPSQKLDTFQGKLLRINPDGSIPADNPFFKTARGKYRAIWARGLRNPFTFAVQPGTGRIFINDVGEARWEEINEGVAGANYGWPHAEGPAAGSRFRNPLHAYDRSVGKSIAGGTFYNPAVPQFPREYQGKYFFADFIDNWIRVLDPDKPREVQLFARDLAGPVDLQVAPDGSLYYLNRNAWVKDAAFKPRTGSLHRISYTVHSKKPAPLLTAPPQDQTVVAGQTATFTLVARGQAPLLYQWQRNGVPIRGATTPRYDLARATAADHGTHYRCVVSNAHGSTKSKPTALWIAQIRSCVRPAHVVAGLEYAFFKGPWTGLPCFDALKPTRKGHAANFDLAPRICHEKIGLDFQGFIDVARDGAYTFFLSSSGASKLFVAGAEVAGVGFLSEQREASGTIGLQAGKHPLRVLFAHTTGRPALELFYAGPQVSKQVIPSSRLYRLDRTILAAPAIAPAGGSFTGPVWVRLKTPTAQAAIHFTTDGSESTFSSAVYQEPFLLEKGATITARTFQGGDKRASAIAKATFTITGKHRYGLNHRETATTLQFPPRPVGLPRLLSQTGAFRSLKDLTPQPGIIPYHVNAPLWSDGAAKRRWLALPGDAQIDFAPTGEWKFPAGTVFIKHFELSTAAAPRRLETRFLVIDRTGLGYGVTYRWKADQSDAKLLMDGFTEELTIPTAAGRRRLRWTYPSRNDCLVCHTANAGFVLGVKTRQLNGDFKYPLTGVTDNQLRTWNHLGLFQRGLDEARIPGYARLAAVTDTTASLEHRVRSYLDANCAQCHRPGGSRGEFDARFDVPLARQHLLRGSVVSSDLGIAGVTLLTPKDPGHSMIYQRMKRRWDVFNMPPLATSLVDNEALAVLEQWIRSLAGTKSLPKGNQVKP